MFLSLILLILSLNQASAKIDYKYINSIKKEFKDLPELVAQHPDISSARCKVQEAPSVALIEKYLRQIRGFKMTSTVHGVHLEDRHPLIHAFERLTTFKDSDKITSFFNQINFEKKFKINQDCTNVECAVAKIWGKELGLKLLYFATRYKFSPSEYTNVNRSRWTIDEVNDVLITFEDLPQSFYDFTALNKLPGEMNHYKRGERLSSHSETTYAWSAVTVYDAWTKIPHYARQLLLFHELAHNLPNIINRSQGLDESDEWLELGGWIKDYDDQPFYEIKKIDPAKTHTFLSIYSKQNPVEDFAESATAYRYIPNILQKKAPAKYAFIKDKIFNSIEFKDEAQCSDISPDNLMEVAKLLVGDEFYKHRTFEKTITKCGYNSLRVTQARQKKYFIRCILRHIKNKAPIQEDRVISFMERENIPLYQINYERIKFYSYYKLTLNSLYEFTSN